MHVANVARGFMIELGISYEDRSKKSQDETSNECTKRLNQKSMQGNRKAVHSKLLNSTLKSNKTSKKNKPEETTVLKRKKVNLI